MTQNALLPGAAIRWRRLLEDRAIPAEITAAAPVSPYGFSAEAFARWTQAVLRQQPSLATRRALEALPAGGEVLDIGVGTGSASLPLAPPAARIVGVDTSHAMLREFTHLGSMLGVDVEAVLGPWPEVSASVAVADVAVCHSVLYGVAEIRPFVDALSSHARHRVVIVIPEQQWLGWQDDLWLRFHAVRRPRPATAADAVVALLELEIPVHREDEEVSAPDGAATREQAVADVRRRLCLRPEQDVALAEALGDRLRLREGRWLTGAPGESVAATLWWDTRPI